MVSIRIAHAPIGDKSMSLLNCFQKRHEMLNGERVWNVWVKYNIQWELGFTELIDNNQRHGSRSNSYYVFTIKLLNIDGAKLLFGKKYGISSKFLWYMRSSRIKLFPPCCIETQELFRPKLLRCAHGWFIHSNCCFSSLKWIAEPLLERENETIEVCRFLTHNRQHLCDRWTKNIHHRQTPK